MVEQRRGQVTPGKRKRSAREKSVESGEVGIKQIQIKFLKCPPGPAGAEQREEPHGEPGGGGEHRPGEDGHGGGGGIPPGDLRNR